MICRSGDFCLWSQLGGNDGYFDIWRTVWGHPAFHQWLYAHQRCLTRYQSAQFNEINLQCTPKIMELNALVVIFKSSLSLTGLNYFDIKTVVAVGYFISLWQKKWSLVEKLQCCLDWQWLWHIVTSLVSAAHI